MFKFFKSIFGISDEPLSQTHLTGNERNSYLLNTNFHVESDYIIQKRKECYEKFGDDKFLSRNPYLKVGL